MNEQQVPTKDELLDALRSSGQDVLTRLRAFPAARFEQGRYENGWTARQILAHIAAIEWTYPRLIDIAREAAAGAATEQEAAQPHTRAVRGGIDAYNQRQVERRAQASVAELLAEFERNRAATIAAVEAADEALLGTPIRSSGGVPGPLATVLDAVAVRHVQAHVDDIMRNE